MPIRDAEKDTPDRSPFGYLFRCGLWCIAHREGIFPGTIGKIFWRPGFAIKMFLCFHSCFCQEFFQLGESLFQIRCLDGAELHAQKCSRSSSASSYFRGRDLDQYRVSAVSSVFRNHSATSFVWKGRSSTSRSRLSNSVISPAVLGFLILFNARKMCSLRRLLDFGIFFIAGSTV